MRCDAPERISATASERVGLLFLAQRLEELTSPRSLDSHKAYAVNTPTLLREAIEQVEAIRDGSQGIAPNSAECILEELAERAAGNLICSSMIRPERQIVQTIRNSEPDNILGVLKQLKQELSGWAYATQVMSLIVSDFSSKQKTRLDFLAGELVTTLVNLGMSRRHIHEAVTKFFWEEGEEVSSPADLRRLFLAIFPHHHEFKIILILSAKISTLENKTYSSFGVKFINKLPDNFIEAGASPDFPVKDHEQLVEVTGISSFDCHSAIVAAMKKINLIQNLFRMYNHEIGFGVKDIVLLEQCCAAGFRVVRPESYKRRPVTDTSKPIATNKLNALMSSSMFLRGRHYDKFVSVSEFHGHSLESSSLENKLLNLWISLETISPSRRGLSKIDNVIENSLPVLGINYIKRIIIALFHDLQIWDRAKLRNALSDIVASADNSHSKLLLLCSGGKYGAQLTQLLSDMDSQELLRFRLHKVSKMLSDTKHIDAAIDGHVKRAGWQLRRIYRARNHIVHLGKVPDFIAALVDSAHDYFDQLLTTTADISIGPNGFTDFDASFKYLDWEYKTYRKDISKIDFEKAETVEKLLWHRARAVSRFDVIQSGPPWY